MLKLEKILRSSNAIMKIVVGISMIFPLQFLYASELNNEPITDFYQYANQEWLSNSILSENMVVLNNWGILWEEILSKTDEILSDNLNYELDEDYLFLLQQLRNFYQSTAGISNLKERIYLVQEYFPQLMGILFSKITVTPEKEAKINELIHFLTVSYKEKILKSNKIGDNYKDLFILKLENIKFEIGAPELNLFHVIPVLSDVDLEKNIQLAKKYQKKNKTSGWNTPPFETDCFYNFNDNKIRIYAGILYDLDFAEEDDYIYLYATLGRTISHEITHAFDQTGKNYDQNGKKISWIKKIFSGTFSDNRERIYNSLIEQYNNYSIGDSLYVDGKKTLQENFADLGGVEISLAALKLYLKEMHPAVSPEETSKAIAQYFTQYARFWREKAKPEFVRATFQRMHTPQKFRAIGPVYNQSEFYDVFRIDPNSEYYISPDQRISIW